MSASSINLSLVKFGPGLTDIGINAFRNCDRLFTIIFNDLTPPSIGRGLPTPDPPTYIHSFYNALDMLMNFNIPNCKEYRQAFEKEKEDQTSFASMFDF